MVVPIHCIHSALFFLWPNTPIWKCCSRQKRIIVPIISNLWHWDAARSYHAVLPFPFPLCTSFTSPTGLFHVFSFSDGTVCALTKSLEKYGFRSFRYFMKDRNDVRLDDAGSRSRDFRMKFRHDAPLEWNLNHASMSGLMCCTQRRSKPPFVSVLWWSNQNRL